MSDLADYQVRISQVLEDPDNSRYSADLIGEALRWALDEYSKASPQVTEGVIVIAAGGREQSLASLSGITAVLEMEYPYDAARKDENLYERFGTYRRGNALYVQLNGRRVPLAGESLRVRYTRNHSIDGLDGSLSTTVFDADETVVVMGAAGKAAGIRANKLIEAYGAKTGEPTQLGQWAKRQLAWFERQLESLRSASQGMPGSAGRSGWQLDMWDRN